MPFRLIQLPPSSQVSTWSSQTLGAASALLFPETEPRRALWCHGMTFALWSTHGLAPWNDMPLSSSSSTQISRKDYTIDNDYHVFKWWGISTKVRPASTQRHHVEVRQVRQDYSREKTSCFHVVTRGAGKDTVAVLLRAYQVQIRGPVSRAHAPSSYSYQHWFHAVSVTYAKRPFSALLHADIVHTVFTLYAWNAWHDDFCYPTQSLFQHYFHAVRTKHFTRFFLGYHEQG